MELYDILRKVFPHCPETRLRQYTPYIRDAAIAYNVNTKLRFSAMMSQLGVESSELRYMEEIASGDAYDTRTDLGNTPERDGDGRLYKGHGGIQITGRDNHERYTQYLAAKKHLPYVDFIKNPKALATLPYCIDSAFWYFAVFKKLNPLADQRKILAVSIGVNGKNRKTGLPNGWAERQSYYERALRAIPDGWVLSMVSTNPVPLIHTDPVIPDNEYTDMHDVPAEHASETAENDQEVVGSGVGTETPADAIYGANSAASTGTVLVKDRPSTFTKWLVGIKTAVGATLASLSTYFGGEAIQTRLTDKALDADPHVWTTILPFLIFIAVGIGAGVLLMWIASIFYDRSANRSQAINTQKMSIAACPTENTVEMLHHVS